MTDYQPKEQDKASFIYLSYDGKKYELPKIKAIYEPLAATAKVSFDCDSFAAAEAWLAALREIASCRSKLND